MEGGLKIHFFRFPSLEGGRIQRFEAEMKTGPLIGEF
jgi:hypothetical protein